MDLAKLQMVSDTFRLEQRFQEALKIIIEYALLNESRYFEFAKAISLLLPERLITQLTQLVHGPVWDGNVISKSDRNELINLGLAVRVCCHGEQGYTAAKYIGYTIMKCLEPQKPEALKGEETA